MAHDQNDIIKQIALLNAYIETLQEDNKCIPQLKKQVAILETKLEQIQKECSTLWSTHDEFIALKSKYESLVRDYKSHVTSYRVLKKRLKNYNQIENAYLDIRKEIIKYAVGILVTLIVASIGFQALLYYTPFW